MTNRWTEQGLREAVDRWGEPYGEAFALRLYSARLIGVDPALVLHGGGNVSLKGMAPTLLGDEIDVIYVKRSGCDMAGLQPVDLPGIDLAYLRRLKALSNLTDDQMIGAIRTHLLDADAPTPSIETLVHAFLPHRYVDHSHADAVLAVANHENGAGLIRDAIGSGVAVLPYVRPGFELAKAVADAYDQDTSIEGIVLLQHGLITFGDDARTSYERHVRIVDACERFLESKGASLNAIAREAPSTPSDAAAERVVRVAPILRGLLAIPTGDEDQSPRGPILEWRGDAAVMQLVSGGNVRALSEGGPLTGDHLIRTKPRPLVVDAPDWGDEDRLHEQIRQAVAAYKEEYAAYVRAHGGSCESLDGSPRVVLIPDVGLLAWAQTKRAACVVADIAERTLHVKAQALALGPYVGLSPEHQFNMEFRDLQRAKLDAQAFTIPSFRAAGSRLRGLAHFDGQPTAALQTEHAGGSLPLPGGRGSVLLNRQGSLALAGQVVVISGGAGAIGSAVAEVCIEAGAHVAVTDVDDKHLARVRDRLAAQSGADRVLALTMEVTDEQSVRAGYERVVQTFGGVDVIVPNAGIAHVAAIEELSAADFRRVVDVNATGYLLLMREGIRILKRQSLGGSIVIVSSKNVFAPGREFGAYSASKAAGHQLGKIAAIELAPQGIRVNMVSADAVFGEGDAASGLWETVGPRRAKSRDISPDELPEYYRKRNLLHARVTGRHVGNAVVFFASRLTPTTGATLPVDGGLPEAFPR